MQGVGGNCSFVGAEHAAEREKGARDGGVGPEEHELRVDDVFRLERASDGRNRLAAFLQESQVLELLRGFASKVESVEKAGMGLGARVGM
eukprot:826608-Pleurochrysis_carterae.AAC.1